MMTSIAFRLNNEDEVDSMIAQRNADEVRHAILKRKYTNVMMASDTELAKIVKANQSIEA